MAKLDKDVRGEPFLTCDIHDPMNKCLIKLTWEFMRRNKEYQACFKRSFGDVLVGHREKDGVDFFNRFGINPPLNPNANNTFDFYYQKIISEFLETRDSISIQSAFQSFFCESEGDLRDILSDRMPSPGILLSKIYQAPYEVPRNAGGVQSEGCYLYIQNGKNDLRHGVLSVDRIPSEFKRRHKVCIVVNMGASDEQIKDEFREYLKEWRRLLGCKSLTRRRVCEWESYLKALELSEGKNKKASFIAPKLRRIKGDRYHEGQGKVRRKSDSALVSAALKSAEEFVKGGYKGICRYLRKLG